MVKAHSLLYAIYICLIVSVICGALLYFANLYTQLNLHYNLHEELYLSNQSLVNFALGNKGVEAEVPVDENTGIAGNYEMKNYGLLTLLLARSFVRNDTVASAHFIGYFGKDKIAVWLANYTNPLSFSGAVRLVGDLRLPSEIITPTYITSAMNKLETVGEIKISDRELPEINPAFKTIFDGISAEKTPISEIEKPNDSIYYNSFFNATKEVYVRSNIVARKNFKGNFVLRSKDSLFISKTAVLEDVILAAPKITFEEGFSGTVQAFATSTINTGENVVLNYPSVLCVFNKSTEPAGIKIKKNNTITGAVVLFGNTMEMPRENTIEIAEGGRIIGDIYCAGKLMLQSTLYGTVTTNSFFYKNGSGIFDNLIYNVEINALKQPPYFISVPLFETKEKQYGILKKVL